MNVIGTAQKWLLAGPERVTNMLVSLGEALLAMAYRQRSCFAHGRIVGVNITVDIVLTPLCGLYGAALATASVMMMEASLLHIAVRRLPSTNLFAFAGDGRCAARACEGVR